MRMGQQPIVPRRSRFMVGSSEIGTRILFPTHRMECAIKAQGEIHFDWILEGRAIQDVWMIPQQKDRVPHAPEMPVAGNWYGTTIRVYDPALHAWRIYWIDPATNSYRQQIGRPQGADIVQEGIH
jgi:hypothetical protein